MVMGAAVRAMMFVTLRVLLSRERFCKAHLLHASYAVIVLERLSWDLSPSRSRHPLLEISRRH
jgi:hypothetical protein